VRATSNLVVLSPAQGLEAVNGKVAVVREAKKSPQLPPRGRWDGGGNLLTAKKLHEFIEFIQEIVEILGFKSLSQVLDGSPKGL
jgi:hypothetical protein